jgi:preprotein translocase subunit SecD
VLGPVALDATSIEGASVRRTSSGEWTVEPVLAQGPAGLDAFNEVAAACYGGESSCPGISGRTGQLGIVVDATVLSAPTINQDVFEADQIMISGSFDESGATALAAALDAGSPPVRWTLRD